jgi:hypothetical protein
MTADALDPQPLLQFLHQRQISHIIIGGVAVAAHGYPRPTIDLDVVPDPDRDNLNRLAGALGAPLAVPAEGDDFAAAEFPANACDVDNLYAELAPSALGFTLDGLPLRYCGLGHLRTMKMAAGRPRDLDDLEHLPLAEP